MIFPLKNYKFSIPEGEHPGAFLKKRKNHFHEGVDLYANDGDDVLSMQDGTVHKIIEFTGEKVGSPWWNETQAVIIKHQDYYILYGEISPLISLKEGNLVKEGELIGNVKRVLKTRKNNPEAMLHIEFYLEFNEAVELTNPRTIEKDIYNSGLINPTSFLKEALNKKTNILLMVCGSISAYKAPDIARAFIKSSYNVKVILSKGSEQFVKKEVFDYLGIEAYSSLDDFKNKGVLHIELARWADKVLIAPASANTIAKLANGMADDLLTSVFLSLKADVIKQILPVMNTEMLNQKITQNNLNKLVDNYEVIIIPSETDTLACGEFGEGKLPDSKKVVYFSEIFNNNKINKRVVITAGSTIAPIDTIRYITNSAKGGTGLLLAEKFLKEGYFVTVICDGALEKFSWLEKHPRYKKKLVQTTRDLLNAVEKEHFCIYISTMAVSDYEFDIHPQKLKKSKTEGLFPKNAPDVLEFVLNKKKTNFNFIVGFAAETELTDEVLNEKLKRKPVDLLVANEADGGYVSGTKKGFGTNTGTYKLISKRGTENYLTTKKDICDKIYSTVMEMFYP